MRISLKAKYAPYIALVYGFAVFIIGLSINNSLQNSLVINQPISSKPSTSPQSSSASNKLISQVDVIKLVVGAILSLGVLKIFQDMVEDEGREQIKDYKKEALSGTISDLIADLRDASIDEEIKEKCINILKGLRDEDVDKYFEKRTAAVRILKWLNKEKNLLKIVEKTVSEVSKTSVAHEYQEFFGNDIYNCVRWLQCSLNNFRSCQFDINELASANKNNMPGGIHPYQEALQLIKDDLESRGNNTGVVEDFINKLLAYLRKEMPHQ